jgi:hypothetical protein
MTTKPTLGKSGTSTGLLGKSGTSTGLLGKSRTLNLGKSDAGPKLRPQNTIKLIDTDKSQGINIQNKYKAPRVQGPSYADEKSGPHSKKNSNEGFDPSIALKRSNTKLGGIKLQKEKLTIIKNRSQASDDDTETGVHLTTTHPHPQPTNSSQKRQKDISDDEIIFSSEDNDWGNEHPNTSQTNPKQ